MTRATVVASALFAVASIGITAANATVTLYVPGTAPHPQVSNPNANLSWMGPGVTHYATTAQLIGYPASLYPLEGAMALDLSVAAGVEALDAAIRAIPAGEPIQIIGVSQGDIVLSMEERLLLANPPANNDITFIRFADPSSPTGIAGRFEGLKLPGMTAVGIPEAPYDSVNVTRQYDGIANWPADSLNILADINALIGGMYLHTQASYGVDPATIPAYDITTTTNKYGATNTTYFIEHTGLLPILVPLQNLGVDQKVLDVLQGPLKKIIDAGYSTAWSPLHKVVAYVGTKAFQAVVNTISRVASDVGVVLRKLDALGTSISAKLSAKTAPEPAGATPAAGELGADNPTTGRRVHRNLKSMTSLAATLHPKRSKSAPVTKAHKGHEGTVNEGMENDSPAQRRSEARDHKRDQKTHVRSARHQQDNARNAHKSENTRSSSHGHAHGKRR